MLLYELKDIIRRFNRISGLKAVCAGGCLRDELYGKKAKDIDLFVVVPEDYDYSQAIDHAQALSDELNGIVDTDTATFAPSVHPKGSSAYDDFTLRKEVLHVVGIPKSNRFSDIDIIYMNAEVVGDRHVSDTFDFTINMVEFDGDTLYKSQEFIETQNTKNIKQMRENVDCDAERTKKRIAKLSDKFEDHTWTFLNNLESLKTTLNLTSQPQQMVE